MSHISSIHFKKSNPIQAQHNDRLLSPSYLVGGDFEINKSSKEAILLKNQIIQRAIENYNRAKAPKAPNFKAKSYEWSAVCNIKPTTTMQDLEALAKHFESKYGFQCYQIAIHRDEGHIDDSGKKVINHHAHLEFITLDKETGKSLFRAELQQAKAKRQFQTEVAEILQMERGQDKRITKRERVEPRIYGAMKEQERKALQLEYARVKHINKTITFPLCKELGIDTTNKKYTEMGKQATQEIVSLKDIKAEFESFRKEMIKWGFCNKDDYKIRTDLLNQTLENAKEKQFTQDELNTAIVEAKREIQERHKQEIEVLESKNQSLMAKISDLNQKPYVDITQEEFNDLKANYEAKKAEVELLKAEVELLDNFIKPTSDAKANDLELHKMKIEDYKMRAENTKNDKAICEYVNATVEENRKMGELIQNYRFLERYFSFEPYRELYKTTKDWIEKKVKQWNLSRERELSR